MNQVAGVLICCIIILCFYGYVYACLKISGAISVLKQAKKTEYILGGIFFIISSIFVAYMLSKNQFIYFWDCTMHWTPTICLSNDLFVDPIGTLKTVYNTTGITDYNWTMPLLYALPAKIFGASFMQVVLCVYIFYMCPAFVVISICINKYLQLAGYYVNRLFVYAVMTFLLPIVLYVLLKGYLDPPILILSTSLLILAAEYKFDRFDLKRNIMLIVGILTMVIFRRHWAYWTIGLIFSLGIEFIFQLNRENWKKTVKYFVGNMLFIAFFCIAILCFFFPDFLKRSLRNYYDIYAGWNKPLNEKLLMLEEACGNYLLIAIVCIGFVLWKNRKAIKYVIRMLIQMWIPTILMMSVVRMHESHFYFEVVPLLVLLAFIFEELISRNKYKKVLVGLSCVYVLGNFVYCFYNPKNVSGFDDGIYRYVICDLRYQPYYREDIDNIHMLVDYINDATATYDVDCYVCASSQNINTHMLDLADAPDSMDALQRDLSVASSDLRDGFSTTFFDAGIVIVEKNEDDQALFDFYQSFGGVGVRDFLSDEILDKTGPIGRHYELIGEYDLNYRYNSCVQVYLKVSDYEDNDYQYMMEYYDALYPDHKELFSERIREYMDNQ